MIMRNRSSVNVREAYRAAVSDMKPMLAQMRKDKYTTCLETWVVGVADMDTIEVRKLNKELGITSEVGLSQWYKK